MSIFVKINCVHNVDDNRCTHPKVKRSFWGLGPKMCSEWIFETPCKLREGCPKRAAPPPPIPKN
jgi:hypothetical protein